MKPLRILACALLLSSWAWAQNPNGAPPEFTVSQLNIPLETSLPPVTQANIALVGNPGTSTYRYWLVANYTFGQAVISKPFKITNAPTILSGSNYVTITPAYPSTATSVDLLRTTSDTPPSGTGNYAVATGVTSGTISDTGAALTSYTVNAANPPGYTLCLTNQVEGLASSHLILSQGTAQNCNTFIADLSAGGSGGADITVNGGSTLNSPVNFQDGTSGNVINFLNPNGSNIQATIQPLSVTNGMLVSDAVTVAAGTGLTGGGSVLLGGSTTLGLAALLSAGSCTSCNLSYNAEGQILSATTGSGGSGLGASIFNQTTSVTNTGTTPVSMIGGAKTIPSADFITAAPIIINIGGIYDVSNSYAGTVTLTVLIDGTSSNVVGSTAFFGTGSWSAECQLTTYTTGTSGTYAFGCPIALTSTAGATSANGGSITFTGSLDTTVSHTFDFQWTWSSATTSPTVTGLWATGFVPGAGVGTLTGGGTAGTIPEWTSGTALGNSPIVDGGTTGITVPNPATGLFRVQTTGGATNDGNLQVGGASASSTATYLGNIPLATFQAGSGNYSGCEFQNSGLLCESSTNTPSGGFSQFRLTGVSGTPAGGSYTWELTDQNGFTLGAVMPGSTVAARPEGIVLTIPNLGSAFFTIVGPTTVPQVAQFDNSGDLVLQRNLQLGIGSGSGFAGSLSFMNLTSGIITINPPTGALGTVNLTLPTTSGTLCVTSTCGNGTVTTTGSPVSGNLTKFSGGTSITNGDLAGDVTTSGSLGTTVVALRGATLPTIAAATGLLYDAAGTLILPAILPTAAMPGLTGDATNSPSSLAMTVVALRNATLPTIAAATGLLYDTAGILSLPGILPTAAFPALTGDITTPGSSLITTLATVNSTPGSFTCSNVTANAKGLITAIANGTCGGMLPLTTLGDTLYENATPANARLPGNTSTTMAGYTQTGTGSLSAAPAWTLYVGGGTSPLAVTATSLAQSQIFSVNSSGVVVNAYQGVNVNAQTGDYTFSCPSDRLGEIEFNITAAHGFYLPQAGSSACTGSSMGMVVRNTSTSTASLTVCAGTGTNGSCTAGSSSFLPEARNSITLPPGAALFIYSDATSSTGNYHDISVSTPFGGVNEQTTNYTLTLLDKDKVVVMNCTAACVATLPAAAPSTKWNTRILSIGSTLATVSLNSLLFNGASTPPTLTTGQSIEVATDGSNYFGDISTGGSGAGANTALSNLASVSINTALLAQTGVDLGSTAHPFRNLYLFGGGTYGTDSFEFTGTSTANRTVTFADNSGTVAELNLAQTFSATQSGTLGAYTQDIASGTAAMGTSAIASGACATVVTVSASGVATTDAIKAGFNGDPTAVTGYGASATGAVLTIYPYPTANNVNFKVCNSTASSITPGSLTLNWTVQR